jgi:thiazole synthase
MDDLLTIAGKSYSSRLLVGTGKYKDFAETRAAIDASGAQIVTVAIRRTNIGQDPNAPSLLDALPPSLHLPAQHRRLLHRRRRGAHPAPRPRAADDHKLVKLEVLGDPHPLPQHARNPEGGAVLVKEGFEVMVYCADDPIQAKMLEDIGCVAVMPLAS